MEYMYYHSNTDSKQNKNNNYLFFQHCRFYHNTRWLGFIDLSSLWPRDPSLIADPEISVGNDPDAGVTAPDCEVWVRVDVDIVVQLPQGDFWVFLGLVCCLVNLFVNFNIYFL